MSKNTSPILSIGTSLILSVFIIITLVTFSIMAAVSAKTDAKASNNAALRTTAYYDACNLANEKLAQIDSKLKSSYGKGRYKTKAGKAIMEVDGVIKTQTGAGFVISIDKNQELYVEFSIENPSAKSGFYKINTWQVRPCRKDDEKNKVDLIKIPD